MSAARARRTEPDTAGDWRNRAACRAVDPELFYPAADSGRTYDRQVAKAKAVCRRCPVQSECLAFALRAVPFGIAGGMTEEERRSLSGGARKAAVAGRPVGGSIRDVASAGRAAIRAGRGLAEVAREFGVSDRTAARWMAQVREVASDEAAEQAERSRGCNRAPLQISQAQDAQAGMRALEGHRG